jgi:hypothetical protein
MTVQMTSISLITLMKNTILFSRLLIFFVKLLYYQGVDDIEGTIGIGDIILE